MSLAKARNTRPSIRSINTKFIFCVLIMKEQVQGSLWCSIRVKVKFCRVLGSALGSQPGLQICFAHLDVVIDISEFHSL